MSLRIYKRKQSPYYYIRGTVTVGGKTETVKPQSTGLADKPAAENYRAKFQSDIQDRLVHGKKRSPAEEVTLAEASILWSKHHPRQKAQRIIGRRLLDYLGDERTLSEVDERLWLRMKAEMLSEAKGTTIAAYKAVLRGWFHAAGIKEIPDFHNKYKAEVIEVRLSDEEADRLIGCYDQYHKGPAITARYTGMRGGEIAQLKKADLDWQNLEIVVRKTKGKRSRRIPMNNQVVAVMQEAIKNKTDYVFVNEAGENWPYEAGEGGQPFYQGHLKARKAAGLYSFRWHDWRHHWAYTYASQDGNLRNLMYVGGWSKLDVLLRYLVENREQIREAMRRMA